jgi:hypothetical protein
MLLAALQVTEPKVTAKLRVKLKNQQDRVGLTTTERLCWRCDQAT